MKEVYNKVIRRYGLDKKGCLFIKEPISATSFEGYAPLLIKRLGDEIESFEGVSGLTGEALARVVAFLLNKYRLIDSKGTVHFTIEDAIAVSNVVSAETREWMDAPECVIPHVDSVYEAWMANPARGFQISKGKYNHWYERYITEKNRVIVGCAGRRDSDYLTELMEYGQGYFS